jgi:hypothetical protein
VHSVYCVPRLVYFVLSYNFRINIPVALSVNNCDAAGHAIGSFVIITLPSTSALFFFRVKAVYCNNKIITSFFGFLLIALVGTSFLIPLAPQVTHVGTTKRCITIGMARFGFVAALINFFLDTLVFVAISVRIVSHSVEGDTFRARMKSFMKGYGLPNLSKSLLQGGQLYYAFVALLVHS